MSYETLLVFAGLLFKFTTVKMRGPNKFFKFKKINYCLFVFKKQLFKF